MPMLMSQAMTLMLQGELSLPCLTPACTGRSGVKCGAHLSNVAADHVADELLGVCVDGAPLTHR